MTGAAGPIAWNRFHSVRAERRERRRPAEEVRVTRTTTPHIRSGVGTVEDDLLRRYVVAGDLAAREELVARMRPIIRRLARRYRHTGYVEDLEQAAALGLTKALERFDPGFGTDFVRYAVPTMIGEMRRWLRDHTWAVRPPREAAETWLELLSATERLSATLGHAPTTSDLAEHLDLSVERVIAAHGGAPRALGAVARRARPTPTPTTARSATSSGWRTRACAGPSTARGSTSSRRCSSRSSATS